MLNEKGLTKPLTNVTRGIDCVVFNVIFTITFEEFRFCPGLISSSSICSIARFPAVRTSIRFHFRLVLLSCNLFYNLSITLNIVDAIIKNTLGHFIQIKLYNYVYLLLAPSFIPKSDFGQSLKYLQHSPSSFPEISAAT